MPDIPGWDEEIHGSIKALVQLVGDRLDLCTTSVEQLQVRQCAAAYLARVRRLIIGMDLLYEAEMPDLIGGPLRMYLEAWATAMWVLAVGTEALAILSADHVKQNNRIIERAGLDLQALDPVADAPGLPGIRDRFQAAEDHLVAEGDTDAGES